MKKPEPWTPDQLLEAWGLRSAGRSLTDPVKVLNRHIRAGDRCGMDDELQAVMYVERTAGFFDARPVLKHVYCEGLAIETFRILQPGDAILEGLARRGWVKHIARPWKKIPQIVLDEFIATLADRCVREPFVPFHEVLEESV